MEIEGVLKRLERFQLQEPRHAKICSLIEQFGDKNPIQQRRNQIIVKGALFDFDRFGKEEVIGKIGKEKLQNVLTAYLFYTNRQIYQKEGGKKYDFEKESRQIEAVVAALEGKHVHMGTGEGKSSAVLPITAIVEALTSDRSSAVLSTVSDTLLDDIVKKTKQLSSSLSSLNERFSSLVLEKFDKQISPEYIDDNLFLKMEREALFNDGFSDETKKQIRKKYWRQYFFADEEKAVDFQAPPGQSKINFITERDLVFEMSKDREGFVKNCPRVFMDEADVSFNRKSPYIKTQKDRFVTPEEIQNSTYQWLFNYVVARQINANDFESFHGRFLLKDGVINKINLKFEENNAFLKSGLEIVAKKLNLSEKEKSIFYKKAIKHFQNGKPEGEALNIYTQAVGDILAEMTHKKNRDYLLKENGVPVVRDSYVDELLEEHENQPEYQLAILALNNQFDFVLLNQAISSAIRFPTFVSYAADKLVCFSGTLLYQGLKDKKFKNSSFARFLEDATGRKVKLITPPEKKTPPVPDFFKTTKEAEIACIESLNSHQNPVLLINYEGVDHTQKIYNQIKNEGKRVVLLPPKPSAQEEEKKYNQYLGKITKDLAEGEIDVIVSSGAAGVGVNIVKSDGGFPDLSVVHFGIPNHEALISQGNGRRRAPGNSFSWYLSQEILESYLSYFPEEKADKFSIALGEIDQMKTREMVEEAINNPQKRLSVVSEILKQKQRKDAQNDKTMIEYDLYFQKIINKFRADLSWLINKKFPEIEIDLIKNYVNLIGVPQSLYYEILQNHPVVPGSGGQKAFVTNLNTEIFFGDQNWFDKQLNQWFKTNEQKIYNYDQQIFSNLEDVPFLLINDSFLGKNLSYRIEATRNLNSDSD